VVIAVERSARVGIAEHRGPLGRDDGAELVRWDNFAANLQGPTAYELSLLLLTHVCH
jgi:hypothetical protein